ncbi:MAG: hypothetical protein ACR2GD_11370 [Pyrinomonadaceae bacterium]
MKKFIATFLTIAMMAIMLPLAANAQTYQRVYRNGRYQTVRVYRDNRSFYQKHRDKINVGVGTGAGLILGGLIGGRKGAGIGALIGAGGSALYTYKIRKNRGY